MKLQSRYLHTICAQDMSLVEPTSLHRLQKRSQRLTTQSHYCAYSYTRSRNNVSWLFSVSPGFELAQIQMYTLQGHSLLVCGAHSIGLMVSGVHLTGSQSVGKWCTPHMGTASWYVVYTP